MPSTTIEERNIFRKEAASRIDPATAEITFEWGYVCDPYGEVTDLHEDERVVGRNYFAWEPVASTWVFFGDLPEASRKALWQRIDRDGDEVDNAALLEVFGGE